MYIINLGSSEGQATKTSTINILATPLSKNLLLVFFTNDMQEIKAAARHQFIEWDSKNKKCTVVKTGRMTKGGGGEGERALTSPSNWALSPLFGQPWGRTLLNWHIPWQAGITNPGGRAKPLSNFTPRDVTSGNSGTAAFHKGKHATVFTKVIAIKLSSKTVRKA